MTMLDCALDYALRGWSVIPVKPGTKQPAVSWKLYQNLRPSEEVLGKWFDKNPEWQLAVVTGAVSENLAVRDFDDMLTYERWAGEYRNLSDELPTVATQRGRHVYFRTTELGYRQLPGGEYRGEGHFTLLPPSKHPKGGAYSWIVPLPQSELPIIDDPVKAGLLCTEPEAWETSLCPVREEGPGRTTSLRSCPRLTQRTYRFLKLGATESHRNSELFVAACDMASKGITRREAEELLLEACKVCQPPYPEEEALATISSAYSKARWQARISEDPWGIYSMPRFIAQRRDLTLSDKCIWAALDYRQRDKGDCFPKLATIARDVGVNRDTVARSIRRLETKGLLEVKGKRGEVNRYTTHLSGFPTPLRNSSSKNKLSA